MDNETAYRALFNRFARPDDKFDEEWVEAFQDAVIEQGQEVRSHSWGSDNPGGGADMILIYLFRVLFFTSTDFGFDGSYTGFIYSLVRPSGRLTRHMLSFLLLGRLERVGRVERVAGSFRDEGTCPVYSDVPNGPQPAC
jgi:hypothetical protein